VTITGQGYFLINTSNKLYHLRSTLILLTLSLGAASFGLWQLFTAPGFVYYTNGYDECNYLQYWFSRLNQSVAWRPGQALVTLLHNLGVSGGKINLLFDVLCPPVLFVLLVRILRAAKLCPFNPVVAALFVLLFPIFVSALNPILEHSRNLWITTGSYSWITIPEGTQLAWWRTPEPQISYIVLALITLLSIHLHSILPVLLGLPLLYSFVSLPCLFLCCCWILRSIGRYSVAVSALLCGCCVWLYTHYGASSETLNLTLRSHLPLLSWCGILNLSIWTRLRKKVEGSHYLWCEALVWAPWFAANQQIISGVIIVPSNGEQYVGLFTTSILMATTLFDKRDKPISSVKSTVVATGLLCAYLGCSWRVFSDNERWNKILELTPPLLSDLATRSAQVAVNDVYLSTTLSLLYPKQSALLFSFPQVYLGEAAHSITRYRCAKAALAKNPLLAEAFEPLFIQFDAAYLYETEDNPLHHLGRAPYGNRSHDTSPLYDEALCPQLQFIPYIVTGKGY
jgi:hypothetical protein